jgi:hypothetical protein
MNNDELAINFLSGYFGDELNENVTNDEIAEAICELNEMCDAVNEYFGLYEDDEGMMDFDIPSTAHSFVTAKADRDKRKYRVGKRGKAPGHLAREG